MTSLETRFIALEPDDGFARLVHGYKERLRGRVGEQVYLDHPPHMTLYSSVFPEGADLSGPLRQIAGRLTAPQVAIRGWHVFEADQLTGNHTLVCNVTEESRVLLRRIQQAAIDVAAPLRDRQAARACYGESWDRLSDQQRANVERFGFPFVGPIWRPHVTVASVRPEDWEAAWAELEGSPPETAARFPFFSLFGLEGDEPFLVERFALEGDE